MHGRHVAAQRVGQGLLGDHAERVHAGQQHAREIAEIGVPVAESLVVSRTEAAKAHITAGADVLTGTAQMVVGAIGKAEENNVLWFGTQSNQSSLAPSIVVASQVYHWEGILNEMISLIKSGTLGGQSYQATLAHGGEVIEFNRDSTVAADAQTLAEQTIQRIVDGTITIPLP